MQPIPTPDSVWESGQSTRPVNGEPSQMITDTTELTWRLYLEFKQLLISSNGLMGQILFVKFCNWLIGHGRTSLCVVKEWIDREYGF